MESFSLDTSCAETDLVEWTWSRTKITSDYGPADPNPHGTISEILVRSRPPRTKITGDFGPADQNPRGTISEILVRLDRNRPDQNSGDISSIVFLGVSQGMHFRYLGGIVRLRNAVIG